MRPDGRPTPQFVDAVRSGCWELDGDVTPHEFKLPDVMFAPSWALDCELNGSMSTLVFPDGLLGFGRTISWLASVMQNGLRAPARCSTPSRPGSQLWRPGMLLLLAPGLALLPLLPEPVAAAARLLALLLLGLIWLLVVLLLELELNVATVGTFPLAIALVAVVAREHPPLR